jgi:hypothetical protein
MVNHPNRHYPGFGPNVSVSLRLEIKNILDEILERQDNTALWSDIISNELAQLSILYESARGEAIKRTRFWAKNYYEVLDNPSSSSKDVDLSEARKAYLSKLGVEVRQ